MKRILIKYTAVLVCLILSQTKTFASSHREAPLISNDPLADNTDVYAFRSPSSSEKVILIANFIPFEHPAGGPNWYTFGEDIRYEIHIENNGTPGDDIIYRFTFKQKNEDPTTFFRIRAGKENLKTTYTLERSTNGGSSFTTIVTDGYVPPPNIGPRSINFKSVGLGQAYYRGDVWMKAKTTATTGERVFAAPIDDPFFVDLGGIFDLGNMRKGSAARDGLAGFNTHTIALEVPISTLSKNGKPASAAANILDPNYIIGVYASASRRKITTFDQSTGANAGSGEWVQVSRLGMPLTNEAIIPVGDKDEWNFTHTNNETKFEKYFVNPELALYMDDSQFGSAVPSFSDLRMQSNSLGQFDFRNGKAGLFPLKGKPALDGTALADAPNGFGDYLLRDAAPRSVDLLPIFYTGVPNLRPYQLATGKEGGNPLAEGKPFINNFLPTFGDMLRLNMAVPATPRKSPDFNSLGLVWAAVLGLTDSRFNTTKNLQFIPNMDGFPNGRRLEDDVTRIELQAVSGIVLAAIGLWYDDYQPGSSPATPQLLKVLSFTAGPTHNDTTFNTKFPFVQLPWRGFRGPRVTHPGVTASNAALPMRLVRFDAKKQGQAALLQWSVVNVEDNNRYEIERSTGSESFQKIGTLSSSRNREDYEFYDASPSMNKINNYRIKQVDVNGHFTYTEIRPVKFDGRTLFVLSPNPAADHIRVSTDQANLTLHVYDGAGKRVLTQKMSNEADNIDLKALPKGVYTVVAEKDGLQVESARFVKQ